MDLGDSNGSHMEELIVVAPESQHPAGESGPRYSLLWPARPWGEKKVLDGRMLDLRIYVFWQIVYPCLKLI